MQFFLEHMQTKYLPSCKKTSHWWNNNIQKIWTERTDALSSTTLLVNILPSARFKLFKTAAMSSYFSALHLTSRPSWWVLWEHRALQGLTVIFLREQKNCSPLQSPPRSSETTHPSLLYSVLTPCSDVQPPPSRPPEHGAQLALRRTDLSVLQWRLSVGDKVRPAFEFSANISCGLTYL